MLTIMLATSNSSGMKKKKIRQFMNEDSSVNEILVVQGHATMINVSQKIH